MTLFPAAVLRSWSVIMAGLRGRRRGWNVVLNGDDDG
jgi:hypothetical protein